MSASPPRSAPPRSSRRVVVIAAVLMMVALVAVGLVVAYQFFFGSDAPDAPTLDGALQVLMPSASPE
jgi:hypothetical protein